MRAFFGPLPKSREDLLEVCFQLQYYLGVTYRDFWTMPLQEIRFFLDRLTKELNPEKGDGEARPVRGAHANDPESRMLMGHQRAQVPSRLQRMT